MPKSKELKRKEARERQLRSDIKCVWSTYASMKHSPGGATNSFEEKCSNLEKELSNMYHELLESVNIPEEEFKLWLDVPKIFFEQPFIQNYRVV